MPAKRIPINLLRIGMFIRLELRWYEHPFFFNSFKIKSNDQIQTLKELGLTQVIWIPEKSDPEPAAPRESKPQPQKPAPVQAATNSISRLWEIKKEKIKRLKERNLRLQRCEKQYQATYAGIKKVMTNLLTGSQDSVIEASCLVKNMVDILISEKEIVVHLMNVKAKDEGVFYHVLNVAILGMLLGRESGLTPEQLQWLGMGALFHDIGKCRISKKVLYKRPPLAPSERKLLELHPVYGQEIVGRIQDFPQEALEIIRHHHETLDGKGYPDRLEAEHISKLSRIIAIVNTYDNYCNPYDPADAMTPHEALSYIYSKQQHQLDKTLIALLVRNLGVYPPGTIVQLSNELIGMVISLNSQKQLRPSLLIYDRHVPKGEAIIHDMEEENDVSIVRSIRPSQLPPEIYAYLNPRTQVSYFVESTAGGDLLSNLPKK